MDPSRRARLLLALARGGCPSLRPPPAPPVVLRGTASDLIAAGIEAATADRIVQARARGEPDHEIGRAHRLAVRIVFPEDPGFPADLRGHPFCPSLLYWRGAVLPAAPRVAIVGARAASRAMERFSQRLGAACARAGVCVVSGLARGIDSAAHLGCLDGGGFPVGVLGTGVDRAYPASSGRLHTEVASRGALLSTYPLGARPKPFHFPLRNRIVAALAARVVVVQATEESGSISTARAALDTGADVCAVPGSPDDLLSRGSNRLIRDGAHPILEPADLLDPLVGVGTVPVERRPERRGGQPTADDLIRLQIGSTPMTPEEIAAAARIPLQDVVERLVRLEVAGRIDRLPGRLYRNRDEP